MTAVSRLKLQQISYFKTVLPKPVPLNRAISSAHNDVLFQHGQCSSTEIVRSKVCKLLFNPGSSMVEQALQRSNGKQCYTQDLVRPGPGLVNTIFAESWGQYGGNVFSAIQLF